jgi:heptosyltransferase-1
VDIRNNILFIRLRLLGDIIFTIPAIQIYKKHFPDSRVYYVAEEKFKEIAALIPGIHKVIVIPRKMGIRAMWTFRREMKKIAFDTVIDFHSGPKSAQLTWLSGIRTRIGYRTPNRNWAYNRLVPRTFGGFPTHSVYNQAKLLEPLGITIDTPGLPPYPPITIPDEQVSAGLKKILFTHSGRPSVVIHVGAGNEFRDWGTDKFSALIERLKNDGVHVYLVGSGEEEEKKAAYYSDRFEVNDFAGKLSIAELFYLISRSSVFFGADSGPLHLASLTPTPLVGLYGPNIPEISGPWRLKDAAIIQKQMECRPCDQRTCIYGIIPCMKTITTDEVHEAIIRYFK